MSSYRWTSSSSDPGAPIALLLPGTGYTVKAPLLYWCAELLSQQGWHVQAVEWQPGTAEANQPAPLVEAELEAAVATAGRAPALIVGKSFGSLAAPWAVARRIAGIWLTPVLTDDAIREALASASSDHLAIGGSRDPMWRPAGTLQTNARLVTVPDADHSLLVPEGWEASLRAQTRVFAEAAAHAAALI